MKKETAVDFLFKSIYGETGHFDAYTTQGTPAYDAYKEAKSMEREEILQAYREGRTDEQSTIPKWNNRAATCYYNQTYKDESKG
jgi:hypothetical protein